MAQRERIFQYTHRRQQILLLKDTQTGAVSLMLLPEGMEKKALCNKECASDSVVHLHLAGDMLPWAFSNGRTMRGSESTAGLRYLDHAFDRLEDGHRLKVRLADGRGCETAFVLRLRDGYDALETWTEFENKSGEEVTLELLTSFSLGFITPFEEGNSRENLYLHRFRSTWAKEGMHERICLEELQLEPSHNNASANSLRFGTLGSMPVREFFPIAAVEDERNHCFWACRLAQPGSWQMEIYRKDQSVCISGGLADYEFGHWRKNIPAGGSFQTPSAYLACGRGSIDEVVQDLTLIQEVYLPPIPAEEDLAIQYADWCTTWGRPTLESIRREVEALKNRGIGIFEIDAGWYKGAVGDWDPNEKMYPNGIREVTELLRDNGFIPGIWFEFENCELSSSLLKEHPDWLLQRDGRLLKTTRTAFLDTRKPEVRGYLREKVVRFLKENNFGYVKVDYNDTIGIGCDGAESLGEGLRQVLEASREVYRELRRAIPDLIIEICASGGHRLEPSMLALGSVASFSDAHESLENPIIAAELQRLVLPRIYLVWVVLRPNFTPARTMYALASGFLGRYLLSGDVVDMEGWQNQMLDDSLSFYHEVKHIIKKGRSVIYNHRNRNWHEPKGYQAVVRRSKDGREALVVVHTFEGFSGAVTIPMGQGGALIRTLGTEATAAQMARHTLIIDGLEEFDGFVAHIRLE